MIYGRQEKKKEVSFEITKTAKDDLMMLLFSLCPQYAKLTELVKMKQGKNRPIKVVLESVDEVDLDRNLNKDSDKFDQVYLKPDRTKENQLAHNKLARQMKPMIEKDPKKH